MWCVQQVQVNLRVAPGELEAIERARGGMPRNAWLRRAALAAAGAPVAEAVPVERVARPVSVRAPRGCRVVGVPRGLREPEAPAVIPGQVTVDEVLAS